MSTGREKGALLSKSSGYRCIRNKSQIWLRHEGPHAAYKRVQTVSEVGFIKRGAGCYGGSSKRNTPEGLMGPRCIWTPHWLLSETPPAGRDPNKVTAMALYPLTFFLAGLQGSWPPGEWVQLSAGVFAEMPSLAAGYCFFGGGGVSINTCLNCAVVLTYRATLAAAASGGKPQCEGLSIAVCTCVRERDHSDSHTCF